MVFSHTQNAPVLSHFSRCRLKSDISLREKVKFENGYGGNPLFLQLNNQFTYIYEQADKS